MMKRHKSKQKKREKAKKRKQHSVGQHQTVSAGQNADMQTAAAENQMETTASAEEKKSSVSEKQLRANRENSKKSTGARTPEGKLRSSKNRLSHGLTGEFCVLAWESQAQYDEHELMMLDELDPKGYREHRLAVRIAQNDWRLQRAEKIETNEIDDTHNLDDMVGRMCLVSLYETRIRRQIKHDLEMLEALQKKRRRGDNVILIDDALFMTPYYARKANPENEGSGPFIPAHIPVNVEEGIRYREHQYDIQKSLLDIPCRHQSPLPEGEGLPDQLAG